MWPTGATDVAGIRLMICAAGVKRRMRRQWSTKMRGDAGAGEQVVHVVVGAATGRATLVLQLGVDRGQFFVHRLQFLLGGFEFLVGRLQFFVDRLHLLVRRLEFLVGGFQFLARALQIFVLGPQFLGERGNARIRVHPGVRSAPRRGRQGRRRGIENAAILRASPGTAATPGSRRCRGSPARRSAVDPAEVAVGPDVQPGQPHHAPGCSRLWPGPCRVRAAALRGPF
jgi:hypothetical protein